jgi:tight adherence protein B
MPAFIAIIPWISSLLLMVGLVISSSAVLALWDQFSAWWLQSQIRQLDALNIDRRQLQNRLRWWGVGVVAIPLIVAFGLGLPVLAPPIAVFVVVAPRLWLGRIIAQRRAKIRTQLAGAMTGLANTCRAGLPLSSGIRTVADELEEPLRSEFQWTVFNQQAGRPLGDVLDECKQRLAIEAFTLYATTVQTTLQRGGQVTEMLDRLSDSVREMDRLERKLDSSTASGRRVILILSIFPVIFLAIFSVAFPEGTKLMFSTVLGQVLLLLSAALTCISIVWTNRILKFRQ